MRPTGGCGGFFASVLLIGVTGQQQQPSTVSAELIDLGGGGGCFLPAGGGTNPSSFASTVCEHNVDSSTGATVRYFSAFFMVSPFVYVMNGPYNALY